MDKATANALHELAATGRLGDDSIEAVRKARGVEVDPATGLEVEAGKTDDGKADAKPAGSK